MLEKYPINPQELPPEIWNAVYSETDPPVNKYIYRYESLAGHVPLRSTSKLLAQEPPSAGSSHESMMMQLVLQGQQQQLSNSSWYHNSDWCGWSWDDSWHSRRQSPPKKVLAIEDGPAPEQTAPDVLQSPKVSMFKPRSRVASSPPEPQDSHAGKPLTDTSVENSTLMDVDTNGELHNTNRLDSEDIEEAAYQRLLNHKKGKGKKKSDGATMKRPAAAGAKVKTELTKKTAKVKEKQTKNTECLGKVININYKMSWSKKEATDKNTFASRHYCRARTLLKAKGANPDDINATLKDISFKARTLWEKHNA